MTPRWLNFNAVGVLGVVIQLAALRVLHGWLRLEYLGATGLAVEAAVLHNFVWHQRWTWRECAGSCGGVVARLLRFNLSVGMVSISTNLVLMRWLVGTYHARYLSANLVCIAAGSATNFLVCELFVFRGRRRGEESRLKGGCSQDWLPQ